MVNLKLKSLKSSGTFDYVDAPDTNDSSPEGMCDVADSKLNLFSSSRFGVAE